MANGQIDLKNIASIREKGENCRYYSADQIVFKEGEVGCELFVVLEGEVLIKIGQRTIDRLKPGDIFGEMALVDDRPRSATAEAGTDCTLLAINYEQFIALVRAEPEFGVEVMSIMSQRVRHYMDEELQHLRTEEELKIGRKIQLSLLPERLPEIDGWEFSAIYRSARQVGGDLYDFIWSQDEPELLHIVVADVTGKGVPAALFMSSSRMAFRAESMISNSPAEILSRTNWLISSGIRSPLFLSAFYGTLNIETGQFCYANGGHEHPYWLKGNAGKFQTLDKGDLLLGTFKKLAYHEYELGLEPGDFLLFYTDGLNEARNEVGDFYGHERLEDLIRAGGWPTAEELLQAVVTDLDGFSGSTPPADDLTLVVIRRQ